MTIPEPLSEVEVREQLEQRPGWSQDGNEITRTFSHTWHECIHLATYVAAKSREIDHHPDIHITWQRIRFNITTHDAGGQLTAKDFQLAQHIDAIAAGHGAHPVDGP